MKRTVLTGLLVLAPACATPSREPVSVAEAYARALDEGRLQDAYALTTNGPDGETAFLERYSDEATRRERAAAVRSSTELLEARAPALTLARSGPDWRVVEARPADVPRAALRRFLDASDAKDWKTAYGLLAAPLRARYTPERLKEDFEREPLSKERLRRARLALNTHVRVGAGEAVFPLGDERAVLLVLEDGEYRVLALE
ncbi:MULTISPECIES: hypothetical protein [unclassified Myxococcus]|uniref:hypothetical protein n=1 Tax=Myxococcus TaxID=32 RepID=UPI001CBFC93E|nr:MULTISPECIES: hypothetical protein [unclassified Myxococcus]MBZ4397411.1 hypothetical protein [Myxococcus sp. AS-1-15]MBZ4410618.1 hypothetical protein [Myxococcus sp. XM-1-1-1]BDT34648.1 hypothetical protein MFMH1_43170 [Myxococcus sp. MH1]